jgi:hypothetical protein
MPGRTVRPYPDLQLEVGLLDAAPAGLSVHAAAEVAQYRPIADTRREVRSGAKLICSLRSCAMARPGQKPTASPPHSRNVAHVKKRNQCTDGALDEKHSLQSSLWTKAVSAHQ